MLDIEEIISGASCDSSPLSPMTKNLEIPALNGNTVSGFETVNVNGKTFDAMDALDSKNLQNNKLVNWLAKRGMPAPKVTERVVRPDNDRQACNGLEGVVRNEKGFSGKTQDFIKNSIKNFHNNFLQATQLQSLTQTLSQNFNPNLCSNTGMAQNLNSHLGMAQNLCKDLGWNQTLPTHSIGVNLGGSHSISNSNSNIGFTPQPQFSELEHSMAIEAFSNDSANSHAYKLLNASKNFILPEFFENLYRKFEQVDLLLSFYKTKITPPFFSNIQSSLRQSSRTSLEIDDLLYMTGIFAGCYFLEWEKNENKRELEIYLDFPQDENDSSRSAAMKPGSRPYLDARKKKMKQLIFGLVKRKHETFLATLDPPVSNYDYNGQGFWHHLFDLASCSGTDIRNLGILPPKPLESQKTHAASVKEFLSAPQNFTTNNTTNNINISISINRNSSGMQGMQGMPGPQTPKSAPAKFPNTTS
jgi:hypothetical protein